MSLFPTQYGNVFGGSNTAGRTELVAFNAGKMDVRQTANGKFLVSPDLKKGKICLTRGDDQLVHFQWVDRQTGAAPEDFIMFPDDATFSRVNTGREGDRVYLLQYKNSARRFFFWMQHKDSSRDEELAKKVNDFMNNVQPSGGSEPGRGGAGNVQLDHNAIMQMLGAMGAGGEQGRGGAGANSSVQVSDLQNILQNMGLPASQTNASPATSAASSSHTSHSGGASSVAATTASTHEHDVGGMEMDEMTEEELLRLAIEESMRDVQSDSAAAPAPAPTAAPPAASQVPFAPAPPAAPRAALLPPPGAPSAAPGMITAADLERAMASIQAFAQPKSISLKKLLSPENVASLLNDETAVRALVQHLPEGVQNAHELQATLHSPQLRQSIGSLVNALQSGNFNAVLANFGLDASAGASKLAVGDSIGAFLDAIQHWANQQDSNMADQSS